MHERALGAQVKAQVGRRGGLRAIASAWVEGWAQRGREILKPTLVEGQLLALCAGQAKGIEFFFTRRARALLLLRVLLGFEPQEVERLIGLGRQALGVDPPALIYVLYDEVRADLNDWYRLGAWLEAAPKPTCLLARRAQLEALPHGFKIIRGLTLVEVEEDAALEEALSRAGDALIASRLPRAPHHRWLAAELSRSGRVLCAPSDFEARWRAEGALDALPEATHALREIDDLELTDEEVPRLPEGRALRAYMASLTLGEDGVRPSIRLKHSEALGLRAGATDEEWRAFLSRKEDLALRRAAQAAGVEVIEASADALKERLRRAAYTPQRVVIRVWERWHWINVTPPSGVAEARVTHHEIPHRPSALSRLWAHVEGWTEAEHRADPLLVEAVERLDPGGEERAAFDLARGWLVCDRGPEGWPAPPAPPRPAAVDPVEALRGLLSAPQAPPGLALCAADGARWLTKEALEQHTDEGHVLFSEPHQARYYLFDHGERIFRLTQRKRSFDQCKNDQIWPIGYFIPFERGFIGDEAVDYFEEVLSLYKDALSSEFGLGELEEFIAYDKKVLTEYRKIRKIYKWIKNSTFITKKSKLDINNIESWKQIEDSIIVSPSQSSIAGTYNRNYDDNTHVFFKDFSTESLFLDFFGLEKISDFQKVDDDHIISLVIKNTISDPRYKFSGLKTDFWEARFENYLYIRPQDRVNRVAISEMKVVNWSLYRDQAEVFVAYLKLKLIKAIENQNFSLINDHSILFDFGFVFLLKIQIFENSDSGLHHKNFITVETSDTHTDLNLENVFLNQKLMSHSKLHIAIPKLKGLLIESYSNNESVILLEPEQTEFNLRRHVELPSGVIMFGEGVRAEIAFIENPFV